MKSARLGCASRRALAFTFLVAMVAGVANADSPPGEDRLGQLPDALRTKVESGSDLVSDGVGLVETGTGFVEIDLVPFPAETDVRAVLLYWSGFHSQADLGETDLINIQDTANDGSKFCAGTTVECDSDSECLNAGETGPCNVALPTPMGPVIEVEGERIGGPTFFFNLNAVPNNSSTYRADVTDILMGGLVEIGVFNQVLISVNGEGFDQANNGATLVVVLKEPGIDAQVRLQDGQDVAFCGFPGDRQVTQPVVYDDLRLVNLERFLEVTFVAGSVEGVASGFDPLLRPNEIEVTVDALEPNVFYEPFASMSGDEWDNVCNTDVACQDVVGDLETLSLPPNETMVTVQAFSRDSMVCSEMPSQACTTDDDCPGGTNECVFRGEGAANDCDLTIEQRPASLVWMVSAISVEEECVLQLDKQISCDGGETWIDVTDDDDPGGDSTERCIGWNGLPPGEEEVVVRYLATSSVVGDLDLFDCVLTDPGVLPEAAPIGTIPGDAVDAEILRTEPRECASTEGQPEEATLVCTCYDPGSGVTREDSDAAGVECQTPGLTIEKECDRRDEQGNNAISLLVTNTGTAPLSNCQVMDPLVNDPAFPPAPFDLMPAEFVSIITYVSGLATETLNVASVTCTIEGTVSEARPDGKPITAVDEDLCEVPFCGDGMLDPEEKCDFSDPNDPNQEICREDCTYCGDGMKDPEEACDATDPNDPNAGICRDTCTYCGDGMKDPEEACDGTDPNDPNAGICRDTCTYCGDGMLDPEEACDGSDPNDPNADICRDTCTYCGDGMLDPEEACDPEDPNDPNAGICRDTCTYCGDGMLDPEEACDGSDPNDPNADICRDTCTYCGDGMLDPEEACDPEDPNDPNAGICRDTCTYCGDGMLDPEEACDGSDPNDPNADICRDTCTYCGDGMLDPEEACDPEDPNDPNAGICRDTCTYCGDGMLDPEEACDGSDPNDPNADICRDTCTYCGDGMLDPEEACDGSDPNDPNADICRDTCTYCGNGMKEPEEACDATDPNDPNADICRDTCTYCGDGMLDPEEACDPEDPNDPNAGICRDTCTYCGDGMLDPEENCDATDPNDPNADVCRDTCTYCGDGMLDPEEACDPEDPNDPNAGICRDTCTYCGDGMKDPEENCDATDPNDPNADICRDTCTYCGDGMLDPEEACDPEDPNDPNAGICRDTCTYCGDGMKDPEENCDATDPNDPNADICRDTCTYCGDGMKDPEEACDPEDPNDPNAGICRDTCTYCGDGMKDPEEACDATDPNDPNAGICRDTCTYCGDGMKDPEEACDATDPNDPNAGICRDTCTYCGDGMLDPEEACDGTDPNDPNADICRETCTYCGDGMLDPEEACDGTDPNDPNADICRETCTYCGDGMLDPEEACDGSDPNDPNADICRDTCTYCGDGMLDPEEACDGSDPNDPNADVCRDDCTYCGDGMLDPEEACDGSDPNDPNADICRDNCTYCGDGMLDPEEACDGSDPNDPNADVCRDNCTYCGDGMLDPEEECDPTDPNDPNAEECTDDCRLVPCELKVLKTCFVPGDGDDDDDDDDDCDGKVLAMKLEYAGDGCDVLTNPQGGKASCSGGVDGAEPVSIKVTDNRGDTIYGEDAVVLLGDIVEASAAYAGQDKFGSQTDVVIDYGLEEITFHTSCSQPLRVGDQFGSMRLVELTTTNGGVVTLPDTDIDPMEGQKTCVISPVPPEPHCEGKVKVLTLRYVGGSCDDSIQDQGDKFSCYGDADGIQPVRIVCEDYLDTGDPATVFLGDLVDVAAANAGDTTLGSQTDCSLYDEFGNWVQDLSFHTSCSKPLNLGDRFGSLEVFSLDTTGNGFQGVGQNVIYTYAITNNSESTAVDVTVEDDQLGTVPGSPIESIAPHETVVLQANALISEDTTNVVTVTGELETGQECPAVEDSSVVTVEETPPGPIECTTKIKAMLLTYIGPPVAGPVTVEVIGRSGATAIHEFPGGLATGTTVSSASENGFTIDAGADGETDLGSKATLTVNGIAEVIHTSCSTPFVAGQPAPLDNPKGAPSPNWFVESFTQKN